MERSKGEYPISKTTIYTVWTQRYQLFSLTTLASSMIYLPRVSLDVGGRCTFFVFLMSVRCRDVHPPQQAITTDTVQIGNHMLASPTSQ